MARLSDFAIMPPVAPWPEPQVSGYMQPQPPAQPQPQPQPQQPMGNPLGFMSSPMFGAGMTLLTGGSGAQAANIMQRGQALQQQQQIDQERLKLMREKAARGPALPAAMQGYQLAKQQGFPGTFMEYQIGLRRAASPSTTIHMPGDDKFHTELAKKVAGRLDTKYDVAQQAAQSALNTAEAEKLLQSGTFAGAGAEWITRFADIADRLGIAGRNTQELAANTRAYMARAGGEVGQVIQQFGSGTGLSDADREFAKQMAGGDINLTPKALARIMRIRRQQQRFVINAYNKQRMRLPETARRYYEAIEMPPEASAQEPPQVRAQDLTRRAPQEGATATNPKTGVKLVFRNGRWVRMKPGAQ